MKILDKKDDPDFGTVFKFEHDNLPPQGVNGKLFLDFSKYADFDYDRMDTEICLALAKTELNKYPIVTGVMPPKLQYGQFENEVMYNFNGDRNDVKDLPQMEKRKFLFFKQMNVNVPKNIITIARITLTLSLKVEVTLPIFIL